LHKVLALAQTLCNSVLAMPPKPRKLSGSRPLKGQWKLPFGVPEERHVREEYRKCGAVTCATCEKGKGHGPYLYAVWREGGKVRRKYLGRA
jgi:hypothetical protein